jgi:hypothetical protein
MEPMARTVAEEVERYIRTGESDTYSAAWSGGFMERGRRAHDDLRAGLVREVRRLTDGLKHDPLPVADTAHDWNWPRGSRRAADRCP